MSKEVNINTNLKLFRWQLDVLHGVREHGKGYIHVVKSKRQCGKSIMIETILLKTAIEKNASCSICLCPTLEQSRKIFNEIKSVIQGTPVYMKHNEIHLNLVLKNGSTILFRSAEQREALRGYTVTGVYCVDEAAYIPDKIFYDTLAWTNVSNAPIVICSTPRFKIGWFYKYYTLGFENGNKILTYNWSEYDTSALLSNERLEQYRREVPQSEFKTEYLGEFLDMEGGIFGDFSDIVNGEFKLGGNYYMGVDWGTGNGGDYTAICVFNDDRQMVYIDYFNDKDETKTIEEIIDIIKRFKPLKCQVEMNSIGSVFYGLLDKAVKAAGLPTMLLKFDTTNASKEKLINNFQVAIQQKRVQILPDGMLGTQMAMYEMKLSPSGKKTYNAASGYHDDCIIAMLLGFDSINKGTYLIR